jgi:hypothetical protein
VRRGTPCTRCQTRRRTPVPSCATSPPPEPSRVPSQAPSGTSTPLRCGPPAPHMYATHACCTCMPRLRAGPTRRVARGVLQGVDSRLLCTAAGGAGGARRGSGGDCGDHPEPSGRPGRPQPRRGPGRGAAARNAALLPPQPCGGWQRGPRAHMARRTGTRQRVTSSYLIHRRCTAAVRGQVLSCWSQRQHRNVEPMSGNLRMAHSAPCAAVHAAICAAMHAAAG